jgi:alpha-L-fucosidase
MVRKTGLILTAFALICGVCAAQTPVKYEPTIESLNTHPLPAWYANAKLGIFVHWGLYSVPGWAPLTFKVHDPLAPDYRKFNPYSEWYYNTMRIDGSPTQAYHREHYGANFNYYDFAPIFDRETQKWNPDEWARIFKAAGARYVVLTTKHHDGFTLWPSSIANPTLPADRQHATRDLVGDLTTAVRKQGLTMGLYYSGGYDWTFLPGPIITRDDRARTEPETEAYGNYAFAQAEELIKRYHPAVLWNDIDWPRTGKPLQLEADYYNAVPDGVVDDRYGIAHTDFTSPEYRTLDKINAKKWEECRGLGMSFGYNRAEGEAQTIAPDALIALLVDIVSKNGNLLLDVGPEADGTIPPVQMERLKALGAWLDQNGEAIYDTTPWTHPSSKSAEGDDLRFTRKGDDLYITILGSPKAKTVTVPELAAHAQTPPTKIYLLGDKSPLKWSTDASGVHVALPDELPGQYAYVLKVASYAR